MKEGIIEIVAGIILALVLFVVWAAFLALPVYFLWNWIVPSIFGLTKITVLQSLGLCLLVNFLFGRGGMSDGDQ